MLSWRDIYRRDTTQYICLPSRAWVLGCPIYEQQDGPSTSYVWGDSASCQMIWDNPDIKFCQASTAIQLSGGDRARISRRDRRARLWAFLTILDPILRSLRVRRASLEWLLCHLHLTRLPLFDLSGGEIHECGWCVFLAWDRLHRLVIPWEASVAVLLSSISSPPLTSFRTGL